MKSLEDNYDKQEKTKGKMWVNVQLWVGLRFPSKENKVRC